MVIRRYALTRQLLRGGIIAPLLFWLTTVISGSLHGDYNHLTGTISELGAIGTRSEQVFAVLLFMTSLLCLVFFFGLCKACLQTGATDGDHD
jgi:hypothetical membrane protein